MMLEAGKSYRTIDDTVHGPLERRDVPPDTTPYVFIDPETGHTWTAEGRWSTDARTDKDLIAEATPPMSDAEMQSKLAITAGIGLATVEDTTALRDRIAVKAMRAILREAPTLTAVEVAALAYAMADAMLAARVKAPVVEKPTSHPTDAERRALVDEGDACPF